MEYGTNAATFKGESHFSKGLAKVKKTGLTLLIIFLAGLLIGRIIVSLKFIDIKFISPFGIAYLLAFLSQKSRKNIIACFLGTSLGYFLTLGNTVLAYFIITIMLILSIYAEISLQLRKDIQEYLMLAVIVIGYGVYGIAFENISFESSAMIAIVNTVIVMPVYYILLYGITRIKDLNYTFLFSVEDILSIDILISLIVAGIGNINIYGVSARTVISYILVIALSYACGSAYATIAGVCMGIIVGLSSGDIMQSVTIYSVVALITGVFKDFGKMVTFLAFIISTAALSIYSESLTVIFVIEAIIASIIFLIIPQSIYDLIELEFDLEKKKSNSKEPELVDVKNEFSENVKKLGGALLTVSKTLKNIGSNQSLSCKNKGTALIENLSDRVCTDCSRCSICWEKDFNITFNSFEKLIKGCEDKRIVFPHHLEKICLKKSELINTADTIITGVKNNEIIKDKLEEGRLLVSDHINNVSLCIKDMLADFNKNVLIYSDLEKLLTKRLKHNAISTKKVFCYRDIKGRIRIKLTLSSCSGTNYCSKNILPIINDVLESPMVISEDGCKINYMNNECEIYFEESPKYGIISYASTQTKDGEKHSGDSFYFGRANDRYMTVISDGMGSGPEAGKESSATVEVIEKYIEAGFESKTAINIVNSIMAMRFEEDEKFATLDLCTLDIFTGQADFIKVGAVASFIKRGKKIRRIISNMPPFGLIDNIEIDKVSLKVKNGDLIIMISDGITDINRDSLGNYDWIEEFLESSSKDPKKLSEDILEKAKELGSGKAKDDMTVLVSRVSAMY